MATNRAPQTVHRYLTDTAILADFLDDAGLPTTASEITRAHLEQWLVYLAGKPSRRGGTLSAATVARAYRSVQQFFRWLVDEDEIAVDPFAKLRPPASTFQISEATPPVSGVKDGATSGGTRPAARRNAAMPA